MKMKYKKSLASITIVALSTTLLMSGTAFGAFEWKTIGGGKFIDGTDPLEAVYMSGNVGIGVSNPTAKLEVYNGELRLGSATAPVLHFSEGDTGKSWYQVVDGNILDFRENNLGGASSLAIEVGGNVGIGTRNPSQKLHVAGNVLASNLYMNDLYSPNNTRYTYISGGNSGSAGANILMYSGNHATASVRADMRLRTNGSNRMHIDGSTGNVGIATVAPAQKLHVIGNIRVSGSIQDNAGQTLRDAGGGWLRTYGSTGWYNGTYGGGWHMSDTTWLRAYNNKAVYVNNTIRANTFEYNSDKNLKKNISSLNNSTDILNIEPKTFDWIDGEHQKNPTNDIGVIAQDVEHYFPQFVSQDPETGNKAVDYPKLAVPLIGVVKQQQEEINNLKAEIAEIKALLK